MTRIGLALLTLTPMAPAFAGAFIFAGNGNSPDIVTHPTGYTGTGGAVSVNVCIDSTSPNAADMVVPVQNIIRTFNNLEAVNPNLKLAGANDIPSGQVDFESVALHEVGHCIGLAHPNLATESGLSAAFRNYTKTEPGANSAFDLDDGLDDIIGSGDDVRGDDTNLHWFRRADNNPFLTLTEPSGSTMSRLIEDLPEGDSFAANADRSVGAALGFPNSEAVMQQGSFSDEDQRALSADDVDTLRLARTGVDRTANTADDYSVTLTYGGLKPAGDASCDLTIDFDDAQTGFAVCQTSGALINGSNVRITNANAFFNTQANWYFNQSANGGGLVQPFSFNDQVGVPPSTVRTSNSVTVQGPASPVAIDVTGGSYSIGCAGSFTSSSGTISSGQTVCVRHTSAAAGGENVDTTLTIGDASDTFSSSTALQPDQPLADLAGDAGSERYYGFSIPAGATNLTVSMSGGAGDADLHVRFDALPTLNDYDCRPFLVGNNETCSFPAPSAGDWFILLSAFDSYSGVALEIQYDVPNNDADGDGIRNELDTQPNQASNVCTGDSATLDIVLQNDEFVQCAAPVSVTVQSIDALGGGGIEIISPAVGFSSSFGFPAGSQLTVISENPV